MAFAEYQKALLLLVFKNWHGGIRCEVPAPLLGEACAQFVSTSASHVPTPPIYKVLTQASERALWSTGAHSHALILGRGC